MVYKLIRLKTRIEKLSSHSPPFLIRTNYIPLVVTMPMKIQVTSKDSNTVIMISKITQLLQSQVSKFFFMKEAHYNHFKIDPKQYYVCDGEVHL